MALAVKPGAILSTRPEVAVIRHAVERVWLRYGFRPTITSGLDGTHMHQSKHYEGLAEDYRTNDLPKGLKLTMFEDLQKVLGTAYQVIYEDAGTKNEHLHIEYDPPKWF